MDKKWTFYQALGTLDSVLYNVLELFPGSILPNELKQIEPMVKAYR
ncbi:unnamed protein product [marine sediment metagenome]|uniref:Uncharacterized protein n=1 Tax=marine sediment metagenome TaxID=412755 RepID=X0XJI8_9ZZZZ